MKRLMLRKKIVGMHCLKLMKNLSEEAFLALLLRFNQVNTIRVHANISI
jgi:kynurenine formamidase